MNIIQRLLLFYGLIFFASLTFVAYFLIVTGVAKKEIIIRKFKTITMTCVLFSTLLLFVNSVMINALRFNKYGSEGLKVEEVKIIYFPGQEIGIDDDKIVQYDSIYMFYYLFYGLILFLVLLLGLVLIFRKYFAALFEDLLDCFHY